MAIRKERMHLVKLNFIFFFFKKGQDKIQVSMGENPSPFTCLAIHTI